MLSAPTANGFRSSHAVGGNAGRDERAFLIVLDVLRNGSLLGWGSISRSVKHCLIDPEPMIILVRMPL